MNMLNRLRKIKEDNISGYWSRRIFGELDFAARLFSGDSGMEAVLAQGMELMEARVSEEGAVTRKSALETEEALAELGSAARKHTLVLAAHAHIDMNWMWGFHETVAVTIATVKTVLTLLERHREFIFSQSQTSVYRILEDYAPELAERVRDMIRKGRWEVTASQWVETDNNLPNAESFARHALYSRRYMTEKYGAPAESFQFVFLPDTFGHHANTPEILSRAGVKYLYHGRGESPYYVYRWKAPSGRSIIVYNDPKWYDTKIDWNLASHFGAYTRATGLKKGLVVYGVGDHGGGPTVRDIQRIRDMMTWPVYPSIRFGTYRDFFRSLEAMSEELPEIGGERNFIFTGCYTSQSRIKAANRTSESVLYTAELLESLAEVTPKVKKSASAEKHHRNLRDAWISTLFNQFHDILPGSGADLTKFHALGAFQNVSAAAVAASDHFLSLLTGEETPGVLPKEDTAFGAGVGFHAAAFRPGSGNRAVGRERRFRIVNQFFRDRKDYSEIILWDWPGKPDRITVRDDSAELLPFTVLETGKDAYWRHSFIRLIVLVELPGFGYRDVLISEEDETDIAEGVIHPWGTEDWLYERPKHYSLENSRVKVVFEPETFRIKSFRDKASGTDLVPEDGLGGEFILYGEEEIEMSSWKVGRLIEKYPLGSKAKLLDYRGDPHEGVKRLSYRIDLPEPSRSYITVKIILEEGSPALRFETEVFWTELGEKGKTIPRLCCRFPYAPGSKTIRGDIPGMIISRDITDLDMPFLSFASLPGPGGSAPGMMVSSRTTYGYRPSCDALEAVLLRSSIGPDPAPDTGVHRFTLHWLPVSVPDPVTLSEAAFRLNNPPIAYSAFGTGKLEHRKLLDIQGDGIIVQSVKPAEGEVWDSIPIPGGIIITMCEIAGKEQTVSVVLPVPVDKAVMVDAAEAALGAAPVVEGNKVTFRIGAFQSSAVRIVMSGTAR